MKKLLVLFLCAAVCVLALKAPSKDFRKKLAGPPSEFADFVIPDPTTAALNSNSALQMITFTKGKAGTFSWQGTLPVDSTTIFTLGLFSPYEDSSEVKVTLPNGSRLNLSKRMPFDNTPEKRTEAFGIDGATVPLTSWTWTQPTAGIWNVEITCTAKLSQSSFKAALLFYNKSPLTMFSHVNSYELQLGQEVGIVANLYDSRYAMNIDGRPAPLLFSEGSLSAVMAVTFPDGKEYDLDMRDDGLHADMLANDGVYGAVFEAYEAGQYTAQAVFSGVTPTGEKFIRTTNHVFNVIPPLITLTGLSTAEHDIENKLILFSIDVDVLPKHEPTEEEPLTVKAYAEVWGTDESGIEYVPIAWVQAMVDMEISPLGSRTVTLQMDEQWMHKASANYPLQLRNVWLEDRDYSVPLSRRHKVFVDHSTSKITSLFRPDPRRQNLPITREMREGPMPLALRNVTAGSGTLLLVHGYCAGANEFPLAQFTNAVQFQDFKQSRTNDAFALKIKEFAESKGITSFSIVGHSQAGLASLHLHTYYFSGLESASGGKLIQSVGSPYGGTGLAGSLASIGGIFGVGCGSNSDLTHDGAKLWSASVPATSAQDVDFYTTIYGSKNYCAWGANMVLDQPNDGTTELKWAGIKGATDKGATKDWCHTTDMTYPGQCGDASRNAILNKNAAR